MAITTQPGDDADPVGSHTSSVRVLSGITPSGSLTLGNYLGALRRFVEGQHSVEGQQNARAQQNARVRQDGFFFIADLHAMTSAHSPARLHQLTIETAALFFASGLDPVSSTVFVQSQVPAHVRLSYLLESTAHVGELGRMIQFKEKGGRPKTRASLFTYPCLMAADILLYQTHTVPVGGDQDQHVELGRVLATRFNRLYGDTFVVPRPSRALRAARVADLTDPGKKMSKSALPDAPGVIRMLDSPDVVRRKVSRAVTDSDGDVRYDPPAKPGVSNMLDIIAAIAGETPSDVASRFTSYGQLKASCVEHVVATLDPIRRRHSELLGDQGELRRLLRLGAGRAREVADPVLEHAESAMGLLAP